jgi:hypothetical protein
MVTSITQMTAKMTVRQTMSPIDRKAMSSRIPQPQHIERGVLQQMILD